MITIDDKQYDETKLSDDGKAALNNIQGISQKQNNLRVEFSHNEILLKHYLYFKIKSTWRGKKRKKEIDEWSKSK